MTQTTLRDYLQSTEDAISNGRIDEAYDHCQYMLTHFPEALEAQRLLGEVYLAQGQLADAQQTFDWVLTNDPENVIAYCDRALISERMADYETALDCYQQAYELSRGNSQIRQEFNTLSAKVGQQGFIFSRAGLARLYMRGDLLSQAIQEWETVLSTTPERLDARAGLLETYWREGLYDQVEQLARNILNDVPGCLKALLLLAHVTFAQNIQASQELLQRAEALDPELTMASELFSDFMASQPHDPFLSLLRKDNLPFDQASAASQSQPTNGITAPNGNGSHGSNGSHSTSEFSESLLRWSSLDNIIEPQQDYPVMQDAAPFSTWTGNQQADSNAWNALAEQEQRSTEQPAQPQRNTPVMDSWGTFGQSGDNWPALDAIAPEDQVTRQTPSHTGPVPEQPHQEEELFWYSSKSNTTDEHKDEPQEEDFSHWNTSNRFGEPSPTGTGETSKVEEKSPAPPAWLDVLTRGEQSRQPSEAPTTRVPSAPLAPEPVANGRVEQSAPVEEVIQPVSAPTNDDQHEDTSVSFPQEDDADFSFGPEWLKSLGARSMNSLDGILTEPFTPDAMMPPPTSPAKSTDEHAATTQQEIETPEVADEPVAAQLPEVDFADDAEQTTAGESQEPDLSFWESMAPVATEQPSFSDEQLEPVDVEPVAEIPVVSEEPTAQEVEKTQSSIPERQQTPSVASWLEQAAQRLAQPEQNMLTTLEELEKDLRSQGFLPLEPGSLAAFAQEQVTEPSLSSALAQLGEFAAQPPVQTRTTAPLQPNEAPPQPLWNAVPEAPAAQQQTSIPAAANQPVPQSQQTPQAAAMPSHLDALSSFGAQTKPDMTPIAKPKTTTPEQHPQPAPFVASNPAPELAPAQRHDALLDMELETTMKRPAVRLQAMPSHRQGTQRSNSGERTSSGKLPASGDLSYKERLLKGYQYQLSGAYDDAMQEYRVIIRNAPEFLGDVVSNMRALLKLAPKYSAGYRVLGDAYMRQGEYLQAMEAYNKALTMAKKGKN